MAMDTSFGCPSPTMSTDDETHSEDPFATARGGADSDSSSEADEAEAEDDQHTDADTDASRKNGDGDKKNNSDTISTTAATSAYSSSSSRDAAEEARIKAERFLKEKETGGGGVASSVPVSFPERDTNNMKPATGGRSHSAGEVEGSKAGRAAANAGVEDLMLKKDDEGGKEQEDKDKEEDNEKEADKSNSSRSGGRSSPDINISDKVVLRASSDIHGVGTESTLRKPSPADASIGVNTVQAALDAADRAAKKEKDEPMGANISPLFGSAIGTVVAKHLCKHDNKNGTLYLATKAACFHSTIFGFEQSRKVIPLATVSAVLHLNDNGIIVKDDSGKTFEFTFQADRDACFNLLLSLHGRVSMYKLNRGQGVASSDVGSSSVGTSKKQQEQDDDAAVLRRSLSMPVKSQRTIKVETDDGNKEEASSGGGGGDATEDDYLAACTVANMADDEMQAKRNLVKEIAAGKISAGGWATAKKYGASDEISSEDLRESWIKHRDAKSPTYQEKVIDGFRLDCTLDEYYDMFLSNDADHGYGFYQRKLGDSELDVTPWHLSEDDCISLCRKVSYVHPVNAPMAPPSAAASKEQILRRWGDHGMCVETRTVVKDVPMTDCFHVDDQILVEPTPDGGISFTGRFAIRFIKRTMFRSIITNTTKGEFVSWFHGYKQVLVDALKEREGTGEKVDITKEAGDEVEVEVAVQVAKPEGPISKAKAALSTKAELYLQALVILVALLVVLQFILMLQIRSSNKAYLQMSAKQDRMYEIFAQMLESKAMSSCDAGDEPPV